MNFTIKQIRLSGETKNKLIHLKSKTGISQWNILCRWALCLSLAEDSSPSTTQESSTDGIEMDWDVFAGDMSEVLAIALKQKMYQDGIEINEKTFSDQLRMHIQRGVGYLSSKNIRNIESLAVS